MPIGTTTAIRRNRREVPNEYDWHFGNKSNFTFNAPVNGGRFMDSGQEVGSLNGVTFTCGASAKDGTQVLKAAGTAYCVPSVANANLLIYVRSLMRWDDTSATTNRISFVINSWSTRDAGTADSATHYGFGYTSAGGLPGTLLQANVDLVTNAGGFTDIGGPWVEAGAGLGNWFIVEWVVNPNTNTWVGRMPDGTFRSFVNANLTNATYKGIYPSWEPFYGGGFTAGDVDAEILDMKASTYEAMSAAQVRFCNDLLYRHNGGMLTVPGYPPPPPPAPTLVGIGGIQHNGSPDAQFTELDGTTPRTCQAGEVIVVGTFNDDSSATPATLTGYTLIDFLDGGASSSLTMQYKIAAGTETSTGIPSGADDTLALVYDGASGVGNFQMGQASNNTAVLSATTFQVTDGSSVGAAFVFRRATGTPYSGIAAPSGMTGRKFLDPGVSGVASVCAAYDTNGGATGYAGANLVTIAAQWITTVVEIKA